MTPSKQASEGQTRPELPADTTATADEFRRELRSLLLVYLALAVLPLLTGFACQA